MVNTPRPLKTSYVLPRELRDRVASLGASRGVGGSQVVQYALEVVLPWLEEQGRMLGLPPRPRETGGVGSIPTRATV